MLVWLTLKFAALFVHSADVLLYAGTRKLPPTLGHNYPQCLTVDWAEDPTEPREHVEVHPSIRRHVSRLRRESQRKDLTWW